MSEVTAVSQLLGLSIQGATAKHAEQQLRQLESQPGFALTLLKIVADPSADKSTRLAGSLFFKNFIKNKWIDENGNYLISGDDVRLIKAEIVGLMIQLPDSLQVQIGEAVSLIAESEFPNLWPELIDELLAKLSPEDMVTNKGVLKVAHSIFKRWRPLFRSDELFTEIKFVLDKFSDSFLALLKQVDHMISTHSGDQKALKVLFDNMLLLVKIYYDLNCQDIPEFFEDHMEEGMAIMHKYLEYSNSALQDTDETEVDIITLVKTTICELVQLYSTRYGEVFDPLVPQFTQTIWNLLTGTGLEQKYDTLVSKALTFMTAIASVETRATVFHSPEALKEITENIILPNITLRESDEELFEDDPIEYTRRDLDGSDSDTRRRAAVDFLRALKETNEKTVTSVMMGYIDHYLEAFRADPSNWRAKDISLYLFGAVATKGLVTTSGVSSVNLLVDVVQFFTHNVAPDLVSNVVHPILKVDAIKFVYTFRNQLTKAQLIEAFPLLSAHFQSNDYVVYTYTAITIEKILSLRNNKTYLFTKTDINPAISHDLLTSLFRLIFKKSDTPEKLAENEFLMKCVMRVILTAEETIAEFSLQLISQLLQIVEVISKNPSNPRFSHYTFESIAGLIKFNSAGHVKEFIEITLPYSLAILSQEVNEFIPYSFQILAYLLEIYPRSNAIPDTYVQLIKPLVSPTVWEFRGNIPAITRLLQAILVQSPSSFAGNLTPILGVFQKLISSKVYDNYGFEFLETILFHVPLDQLKPYIGEIAMILLQRLQVSRTEKYVKRFTIFLSLLSSMNSNTDSSICVNPINSVFAIDLIDQVQNGIFEQILNNFVIPSSTKFNNLLDRKILILGLVNMICESAQFTPQGKYFGKFAPILENLLKLIVSDSIKGYDNDDTVLLEADLEEVSFGSSFSKLNIISPRPYDPAPKITTKELMVHAFKSKLAKFNAETGALNSAVAQMSPEAQSAFLDLSV
ncbi:unnamed protein product [Kuraishia capsulata CBS 1993]|uniref:Importin N-terminal domain-containing protein n=1 Tax=Kuraishia capsulata CBS 1993 TaxID=1382522 RepID=W6MQ12_9ASCO|nr:uncharacterized protein KUCA_T00003295001 [Kuraishia capsulata CBS 1993]CDK27317.1 unnamed protein product [Kuraishia capsulata CBS 1993]